MITLDDIRAWATALPEVEEKTHFGRPGFRVRGKLFASVDSEAGDANAILHVGEPGATAAVADDPDVCEQVWREHGGNRIFVGLRVDLAKAAPDPCRALVETAWRHRAPKRLVSAYDQGT